MSGEQGSGRVSGTDRASATLTLLARASAWASSWVTFDLHCSHRQTIAPNRSERSLFVAQLLLEAGIEQELQTQHSQLLVNNQAESSTLLNSNSENTASSSYYGQRQSTGSPVFYAVVPQRSLGRCAAP